ncbi:hypothetical protein JKP88DRAFT_304746 [Tribonema minus]|uniref:Uncharacterized protein n=1 Tax=Tribonema minus TaxID=303371 RepID=A0A836CK67_9STRA|nr:hypothetical protein JKP88DRAFT_304746 [Tribonema minus]
MRQLRICGATCHRCSTAVALCWKRTGSLHVRIQQLEDHYRVLVEEQDQRLRNLEEEKRQQRQQSMMLTMEAACQMPDGGNECSTQTLDVDAGIDRISRALLKDSCDESQADNDFDARTNNGSYPPTSAFICRDSGEHVEDEWSEADGGSDASSDAWDPYG